MLPLDYSAALNAAATSSASSDPELIAVRDHLIRLDPNGERFSLVLRDTIDQLLNGEVTGRYDWGTLLKTEKTHAGSLVEINLQREFKFADGEAMDYRIAGIQVDCKFSQRFGSWMIPPEAIGHLCLVVWADDLKSQWQAGLIRIQEEILNQKSNRDRKLTIKAEHRNKIYWVTPDGRLPENVLLHMPAADRDAVLAQKSGQARVNELFRRVQQRRITRNVVRTAAQQKDYMKRVRGNGGARSSLRRHGILIMGDYRKHQRVAADLQVPVPREGEFVSVRVTRVQKDQDARPRAYLDGAWWAVAEDQDPAEPAPMLPKTRNSDA
ncbi:NaeI family type II restriction endonuclease [Streptomyces sp. B5E4]|uniref:NaeI family type II restriction endonuclease n=1 Tax=Streptomyces sp. B5E4 TaxID=3153568 RepID=UPI00325D3EF2